jgi:riboflavin synthase alpha subunit
MFQGIVAGLGRVRKVEERKDFRRLGIDLSGLMEPKRGESVSVNGTCLTTTETADGIAFFDVIAETLEKTTLGNLKKGDRVNLEAPINLGSGISGHLVQGHVESVARVTRRVEEGENVRMFLTVPENLGDYMFPKGSIALDGVSMTIVDMDKEGRVFSVAVIPETLEKTTLGFRKDGDNVNIETDFLVRGMLKELNVGLPESLKGIKTMLEKIESRVERLEAGR